MEPFYKARLSKPKAGFAFLNAIENLSPILLLKVERRRPLQRGKRFLRRIS